MVYEFASGAHVPAGADAGRVAETLTDIKSRYGKLTAHTVADDVEADPESHPLEGWFTWDPEIGMRKLHVIEAGQLIRVVRVAEVAEDQPAPVRAFVVTRDEGGEQVYDHITAVLARPDDAKVLIEQVGREKKRLDEKFDELLALVGLLK
jgi:hypothetical protein